MHLQEEPTTSFRTRYLHHLGRTSIGDNRRGYRRRGTSILGGKLASDSSDVCTMGRMAFLHTIPTVQLRSGLVSRSDVSFIVHITLPDHPDPVPTLIDSGATSNFIDAQLATRIPTTRQSLTQPIALCLFDGKPATSGFIHEYIKTTISFPDSSSQSLSLLITQLHPSAPIVLGLPWLKTTNPTIDWASMSLQFQSGTGSPPPTITT